MILHMARPILCLSFRILSDMQSKNFTVNRSFAVFNLCQNLSSYRSRPYKVLLQQNLTKIRLIVIAEHTKAIPFQQFGEWKLIGSGGFAKVHRAKWNAVDCAVKVIDLDAFQKKFDEDLEPYDIWAEVKFHRYGNTTC